MSFRDFALESPRKAGIQKAMQYMGNTIGYDLVDENLHLNPGVHGTVFIPPGSSGAGIPEEGGWILLKGFVHQKSKYDETGEIKTEPATVSNNWVVNVRLTAEPYELDTVQTPIDNFHESVIRSSLDDLGQRLMRPSENENNASAVLYWEYDLGGGDFVRLYYGDNDLAWKNVSAGGNVEVTNPTGLTYRIDVEDNAVQYGTDYAKWVPIVKPGFYFLFRQSFVIPEGFPYDGETVYPGDRMVKRELPGWDLVRA